MSTEVFTNNAATTLGSALGSTDTVCTVAVGTGAAFPALSAGQYFTATLYAAGSATGVPNEIVHVIARSGDSFTIIRAQEGTSAGTYNVGDTIANYLTAGFLNNLVQAGAVQAQAGNSAVDTGSANAGAVTLNPTPSGLADIIYAPLRIFKAASANNGPYTLNVDGIGPVPVKIHGADLVPSALPASQIFEVAFDGTNFELISAPAQITNQQLAVMAGQTIKGNLSGGNAQPADVTLADLLAAIGIGSKNLAAKGHIVIGGLIINWIQFSPFGPGSQGFTWDLPFNSYFGLVDGIDFGLSYSGSESSGYTGVGVNGGTAWTNDGGGQALGLFVIALGI